MNAGFLAGRLPRQPISNTNDYIRISEDFCSQGLAKACLNAFELKMMEYTPGFLMTLKKLKGKS